MIRIRDMRTFDVERLVAWQVALFEDLRDSTGDPYFAGTVADRFAVRAKTRAWLTDGTTVLIAEWDGEAAGYLTFRRERPYVDESRVAAVGYVGQCRVEPRHRRRGIARALLAEAERRLAAQGITWLEVGWEAQNPDAAATWAAAGFEPVRIRGRKRIG